MKLLLGTHFYKGSPDACSRQDAVAKRNLQTSEAIFVNLQFEDEQEMGLRPEGYELMPLMRANSREMVQGTPSARKPLITEILDILCEEAEKRELQFFGFFNSDIYVSSTAARLVLENSESGAHIFPRYDVDSLDALDQGTCYYFGQDCFIFSRDWWKEHRWRIRPYIIGEARWDNVLSAIALSHSNARIWLEPPAIYHVRHPIQWSTDSPYANYNSSLTFKDIRYRKAWRSFQGQIQDVPGGTERFGELMGSISTHFSSKQSLTDFALFPYYYLKSKRLLSKEPS